MTRQVKSILSGCAAAALLLTGCRSEPNRGQDWSERPTEHRTGAGYDSETARTVPLTEDLAIGEEHVYTDPPEGEPQVWQDDKVGPESMGTESGPSGAAGEGRGWGGSGYGSTVRSRIQETERGMDGGTSVHIPEEQ